MKEGSGHRDAFSLIGLPRRLSAFRAKLAGRLSNPIFLSTFAMKCLLEKLRITMAL
jgi:hypothetical protein